MYFIAYILLKEEYKDYRRGMINMELNYNELGLKVGLEIHQQLNTKRKLFCNCPTLIREDSPDGEIQRTLRTSQSEMGEIDKAALIESKKRQKKIFTNIIMIQPVLWNWTKNLHMLPQKKP